jgi:hypothetical protein
MSLGSFDFVLALPLASGIDAGPYLALQLGRTEGRELR